MDKVSEQTRTLVASTDGDPGATSALTPLVYERLRRLAASYMRDERPGHTLQPTALVHEAYLRMIDVNRVDWRGKTHFFAVAARQMRRILVEHARRRTAQKRGGGRHRVTMTLEMGASTPEPVDVLALEEALGKLAHKSSRQRQVVELRIFGGLSEEQISDVLGVSRRTVSDDWRVARARLTRDLSRQPPGV